MSGEDHAKSVGGEQLPQDGEGQYAHGPARRDAPTDATAADLQFPELKRLELDQLLGQLVERAHEVMATQGRLRGLLRANRLVISDLDLPAASSSLLGRVSATGEPVRLSVVEDEAEWEADRKSVV